MNARIQIYDWDTTHNQVQKTMTHYFFNDVECIVSWDKRNLTVRYKGKTIDVFSFEENSYTIDNHEQMMLRISKIAHGLPFFRKKQLKKLRHVFGM